MKKVEKTRHATGINAIASKQWIQSPPLAQCYNFIIHVIMIGAQRQQSTL